MPVCGIVASATGGGGLYKDDFVFVKAFVKSHLNTKVISCFL